MFDNPSPSNAPVYGCVADHLENLSFCEFDRQKAIASSGAPAQLAASQLLPSVGVVDLTDFFCPTEICPPVIGGVLVYRQGSHISDTYIRSLTPFLFERLQELVP